jgi:hypothetical protein
VRVVDRGKAVVGKHRVHRLGESGYGISKRTVKIEYE